jgi:hypothetical protein
MGEVSSGHSLATDAVTKRLSASAVFQSRGEQSSLSEDGIPIMCYHAIDVKTLVPQAGLEPAASRVEGKFWRGLVKILAVI